MTSQKAQIQTLIQEIDKVLNKTSPRLPWVMTGDMAQQRQVLEQTREYLNELEQQLSGIDDIGRSGSITPYSSPAQYPSSAQIAPTAESAQQVLQAVLQEMNYLRGNLIQPLRSDIETLQQQKAMLAQEVQQLQAQRQQYAYSPDQMSQQFMQEFLQSVMGQLQATLNDQVAELLANWETQPTSDRTLGGAYGEQPTLSPSQRLERLKMIQTESDQLLLKLDTTLRVIFESLQSNIHSYQDSLQQGIGKMHNLGQQGESLFAALVGRLAQQLGLEASSYLRSSMSHPPLPGVSPSEQDMARRSLQPSDSEEITDAQIDLLLEELTGSESATSDQALDTAASGDLGTITPPPPGDSMLDNLDLLNLDDLDLPETAPLEPADESDEDLTLFQMDQPLTTLQMDEDEMPLFSPNEDVTQIQDDWEDTSGSQDVTAPDINDLDSAFALLNQLNADVEPQPVEELPAEPATPPDVEAAEESHDELDEFYESLFGEDAVEPTGAAAEFEPASTPFAQPVAEAESPLFPESTGSMYDSTDSTSEFGESDVTADDLFGGSDVPFESSIAPDPVIDAESQPPQSIEEFLFSSEPTEPTDITPGQDALSGSETLEGWRERSPADTESTEDVETIAALSDLIPASDYLDSSELESGEPEPAPEPVGLTEDDFIPAAPDEDLLIPEEAQEEARVDLRLAADTLQQLTTDLSNLEGLEIGETIELPADMAVTQDTDWTLADWSDAERSPAEPEPSFQEVLGLSPQDNQEEPLTDLPVQSQSQEITTPEDLFYDLPPVAEAELSEAEIQQPPTAPPSPVDESMSVDDLFAEDLESSDQSDQTDQLADLPEPFLPEPSLPEPTEAGDQTIESLLEEATFPEFLSDQTATPTAEETEPGDETEILEQPNTSLEGQLDWDNFIEVASSSSEYDTPLDISDEFEDYETSPADTASDLGEYVAASEVSEPVGAEDTATGISEDLDWEELSETELSLSAENSLLDDLFGPGDAISPSEPAVTMEGMMDDQVDVDSAPFGTASDAERMSIADLFSEDAATEDVSTPLPDAEADEPTTVEDFLFEPSASFVGEVSYELVEEEITISGFGEAFESAPTDTVSGTEVSAPADSAPADTISDTELDITTEPDTSLQDTIDDVIADLNTQPPVETEETESTLEPEAERSPILPEPIPMEEPESDTLESIMGGLFETNDFATDDFISETPSTGEALPEDALPEDAPLDIEALLNDFGSDAPPTEGETLTTGVRANPAAPDVVEAEVAETDVPGIDVPDTDIPDTERESNAFTLEGLDNLFEDLSDSWSSGTAEAGTPSETDTQSITLENAFEGMASEQSDASSETDSSVWEGSEKKNSSQF